MKRGNSLNSPYVELRGVEHASAQNLISDGNGTKR